MLLRQCDAKTSTVDEPILMMISIGDPAATSVMKHNIFLQKKRTDAHVILVSSFLSSELVVMVPTFTLHTQISMTICPVKFKKQNKNNHFIKKVIPKL